MTYLETRTMARAIQPSFTLLLGFIVASCGPWNSANAAQRILISSIQVREEYTDNLFFSANNKEEDFITTISPGLEWTNNTERLNTNLKARWDANQYDRNDELNSVDQAYFGSLSYEMTPRMSLFTSGGYIMDSRSDRDFTTTGLITGTEHRDKYTYNLGGTYALSELSQAQLKYSYDRESYNTKRYTDYFSHDVTLTLSRNMSSMLANTVGRINLGVTDYESNRLEVMNYTATVGMERKLSEKYSYFLDIGGHYTDSTYSTYRVQTINFFGLPLSFLEPYTATSSGVGFTGQSGLTYNGEVTSGTLLASHSVSPASGENGTVERSLLQCTVSRRLNETSKIGFSTGYAFNKSSQKDLFTNPVDQQSLWFGPSFTYDLTRDITLEASYNYQRVQDNTANTDYDRNLFWIRIGFKFPVFE